jgi:histone deacetylase HOS3
MTAASVARAFLERDLEGHKTTKTDLDLVVIIHDACYGHRFSRPKTSKASLSLIVERPERILATVLGVCCAYIRLGGRHSGAKNAPHPEHSAESIPFRIQKSNRYVPLVSPAVTSVHGTKWMNELKMMCEGAEAKLAMGGKELTRPVQFADDDQEGKPKLHEGDLYLCSESLNALEGALGGVLDAVDTVFDPAMPNRAFVAVRPPGHHCSDDYPSGFCWVNNVHVGIAHASAVHGMTHAAIIDFDLHHGDGSQSITWAHNAKVASLPKNAPMSKRTAIGYFSIHDINSYPCEWGDEEKVKNASLCVENAHCQTIWNVHLQPWKTDADFWRLYETRYMTILEKTRAFLENQRERLRASTHSPQPRAAIFISAGFDASEWEGQGMQRHKVNVPTDFYERLTRDINNLAAEEGLGVDGRVISVLEGGYSDRALTSGVLSHVSGMASASTTTEPTHESLSGLGHEMSQRLSSLSLGDGTMHDQASTRRVSVDRSWWSQSSLEELENLVSPPLPAAARKPRGPVNPTYTTPTQSYVAKVVSPTVRRSISSSLTMSASKMVQVNQPVPEANWVVAAHELSKILTPDRQTRSCKPEDLNAKATEIRRNRQSTVGIPPVAATVEDSKRMQLRERRSKVPDPEQELRTSSRTGRRTTFGGIESTNEENNAASAKAPRRRVSMASTILSTAEEGAEEAQNLSREPARRLSSSSLIRPTSSASNAPSLPVEVRKPRSPPKPRAHKPKAASAVRPPTSRIPSSSSQSSKPGGSTKSAELDALTGGMKKMSIKLNMPTKSEPQARESKPKATRAPRKTIAAPRASKKATTSSSSANALPSVAENETTAGVGVTTPFTSTGGADDTSSTILEAQPGNALNRVVDGIAPTSPAVRANSQQFIGSTSLEEKIGAELQMNASYAPPETAQGYNATPHDIPPSFLPPDAETIPAPSAKSGVVDASSVSADATSASLEPLSHGTAIADMTGYYPVGATPSELSVPASSKHTKYDLPVFTSTSPIMFGPPKGAAQSMGEILATEAKAHASHDGDGAVSDEDVHGANVSEKDTSDVPATPQQRMP